MPNESDRGRLVVVTINQALWAAPYSRLRDVYNGERLALDAILLKVSAMNSRIIVALFASVSFLVPLLPLPVLAETPQRAPDFYLLMQQCTTTVGYLVLSDKSLKTVEGTPVHFACFRNANKISCVLVSSDGDPLAKGSQADYTVLLDIPPSLQFADPGAGDFVVVDTAQHAAVIITRILHERFAGSKVCWGMFTTEFERKALSGKKK
jgi:hypothetical protein